MDSLADTFHFIHASDDPQNNVVRRKSESVPRLFPALGRRTKTGSIHTAKYGKQAIRRNAEFRQKTTGHSAVGGDDSVRSAPVQPAIREVVLRGTLISPGTDKCKIETTLEQSPQKEALSSVAVHNIGTKLLQQRRHPAYKSREPKRRRMIQSQFRTFKPHTRGFPQRSRIGKADHQRRMAGLTQNAGKRHAIPGRGIVPANIDNLKRAHALPAAGKFGGTRQSHFQRVTDIVFSKAAQQAHTTQNSSGRSRNSRKHNFVSLGTVSKKGLKNVNPRRVYGRDIAHVKDIHPYGTLGTGKSVLKTIHHSEEKGAVDGKKVNAFGQ